MEFISGPLAFFMALMAFLTSVSVGGQVSMSGSSAAGRDRRTHLAGVGSGFHGSAQPIYRPVHIRL